MGPTSNVNQNGGDKRHLDLKYHHGFGNSFRSESIPDSLPKLGHNPKIVPFGLYTEGITGSAFTAPRKTNRRSWFYRVRPSVVHYPYEPYQGSQEIISSFNANSPGISATPQQIRWDPLTVKGAKDFDFIDGIRTIAGAGDPHVKAGCAIHFYQFGQDMTRKAFYNADGDLLFIPVKGELLITTEFGKLHVPPNHVAVVQRSMKFTVTRVGDDAAEPAEGYLLEIYKGSFELPELGPIGGNGLANIEDFQIPFASYRDADEDWLIVAKFQGRLFQYAQDHSPYDVVAWMGNYCPYRYDLKKFNTMGSISFDHPDPSISCFLTVPTDTPGTAIVDVLAFGERWSAVEDTFRPQWFHRNIMSEFMCTVSGLPSPNDGCNLHNVSSAHGPAGDVTELASSDKAPVGPIKTLKGCQLVMIETLFPLSTTKWAIEDSGKVQPTYWKDMWQNIKRHTDLPASSE